MMPLRVINHVKSQSWLGIFCLLFINSIASAQDRYEGPIIDMHLHALDFFLSLDAEGNVAPFDCYPAPCEGIRTKAKNEDDVLRMTIEEMDANNVVLGWLADMNFERVKEWDAAAPGRFFIAGKFNSPKGFDFNNLRRQLQSGEVRGIGEVAIQDWGYSPADPEVLPIFEIAAEYEVPIMIHTLGIGAPSPTFRVAKGDPRLLEEALVRHPKIRLYNENCGFPFADEQIAMMYQYPQLYCDVSTITWIVERQAFLDFFEKLIRAGLSKRIMYGSDQVIVPEAISLSIESIQSAEFLTSEQKADIFYNNAARFLLLPEEEIAKHHQL